jgi:hypothetical protein
MNAHDPLGKAPGWLRFAAVCACVFVLAAGGPVRADFGSGGIAGPSSIVASVESAFGQGSSSLFLPLNLMSQGSGSPSTLLGAGGNRGIGMFYYNAGAGSMLTGNPASGPMQSSYGMLDNLTLAGRPGGKTGLSLSGQIFVAGAQSGTNSSRTAGAQAINQALSYSSRDFAATATFVGVGKFFSNSSALSTALASTDQSTQSAAKSLASSNGQNEQNIAMSLGNQRSGVVSINVDSLSNSVSNKNQTGTVMGYKWGDPQHMQFAFLNQVTVDHVHHASAKTQSFNFNQTFTHQLLFSFGHTTKGDSNSRNAMDQFEIATNASKRGSLDIKSTVSRDSAGGSDRLTALTTKRVMLGMTVGFQESQETKRSDGSSSQAYTVRTIGYSVDKELSKLFTFDTSWVDTTDPSKPAGHQSTVVASSKLIMTPMRDMSIQNLFETNNGVDNSTIDAIFTMPKESALSGTNVSAAVSSASSPTAASTHTQTVALDSTSAKLKSLLALASITNVHLSMSQTATDAWNGAASNSCGTRGIKLAGALAAFRGSQWTYAFASRDPMQVNSGSAATFTPVADSRMFDLTVPIRKLSLNWYDHDQIPQSNGTYKNIKEEHFAMSAPIPRCLNLSANYTETQDNTCTYLTHRHSYGLTFDGGTGLFANAKVSISRQYETEQGNGSQLGIGYNVSYTLPAHGAAKPLTIGCDFETNTFDNRTGAKDSLAKTWHCDYAVGF